MSRIVWLSALVSVVVASLRGEGVEEVGETVERFPPEDVNARGSRRRPDDAAAAAARATGDDPSPVAQRARRGQSNDLGLLDFGFGARIDSLNDDGEEDEEEENSSWSSPSSSPSLLTDGGEGGEENGGASSTLEDGGGDEDVDWCAMVRAKHQVPAGTCELPNNGGWGHHVRVVTKVDKYGRETSWRLVDQASGNVAMEMGPTLEANEEGSEETCLPPGRYNLRFQDIDGLCCRHGLGFFRLVVGGVGLLDGGRFSASVDHDFQLGFNWIDTMSDRDCAWFWAHDKRREDWHTRCYPGYYCDKSYRHLKWSPALAADATDYAERLLETCETIGIEHDQTDQGENLAKNKGSGAWAKLRTPEQVTVRFVDNEEHWGWNRNAHLTQALWYASRYLGCGDSVRDMDDGRKCRMQVCRYAKAGNCQMGQYDSDVGNNWMIPMMMDDSPCGPMCASRDGCYH